MQDRCDAMRDVHQHRDCPTAAAIERPGRALDADCQSVPTRAKMAMDERMSGEETLTLIL
jgi:hypothetical protein